MTIHQLLQEAKKNPLQNDFLAVEVLLAFVLKKGREYLIAHSDVELTASEQQNFFELFERFQKGEPVAYLTNHKEFFGLDFYVDKRVLIPRPETELLVEKVLEWSKDWQHSSSPRVLEIGTGSGCIAIALGKNNPQLALTAADISADALEVARMNAQKLGVGKNIRFVQSDLLKNVESSFDVIVANLPYIGRKRFNFVSKEAYDYEPHLALFGGDDGLLLYEQLFKQIVAQSWKPQMFLGEFGFLQREEIERLYQKYFSEKVSTLKIFQDYANIERVFMITESV